MTIWSLCKTCMRKIPEGQRYCDEHKHNDPARRPAASTWSQDRKRSVQLSFRARLMRQFGGRCAAVGGRQTFTDLPLGVQCPVTDRLQLDAHHGKDGVPDLLLCTKHHAEIDPYARARRGNQ